MEYLLELLQRKPSGAMIVEALYELNVNPDDALFVGDMESDQLAAQNADIDYMSADDFLGVNCDRLSRYCNTFCTRQ